jgi:purine-binding chemotaxis protein CheW
VLTLRLADQFFALPVGSVGEIVEPVASTPVPGAPDLAPALANVRGSVIPVVDMRMRLGMAQRPLGHEARLVVLDLEVAGEPTRLGLVAEAVDSVRDLAAGDLRPMPELGARWPARYVAGVIPIADDLLILLDTQTLLSPEG